MTAPRIPSTKATLTIAQFDLSHQRRLLYEAQLKMYYRNMNEKHVLKLHKPICKTKMEQKSETLNFSYSV